MADGPISTLTSLARLAKADAFVEILQGGVNKKARLSKVRQPVHPGFVPGRWYQPDGLGGGTGSGVVALQTSARFFYVSRDIVIDKLAMQVGVASAATTRAIIGIYNDNGGVPGSVLCSGEVLTDTTGRKEVDFTGAPVTLLTGLYWWGAFFESTPQVTVASPFDPVPGNQIGGTTVSLAATTSGMPTGYTMNALGSYAAAGGTLPAFTVNALRVTNCPNGAVRIDS